MADLAPAGARDSKLRQIGRYRIRERIGKGAMGVVYAARDETIGRDVALKVMMADLEGDPDIRARFFREAQVAAKLAHRNIVTIFDMGEEDGRLYIVMELLRGLTLTDHLKQAKADGLEDKLDLMTQICEGLSVASAAGVFHRDVKPGNLFVQEGGSLKILDFGIARLASSSMTASGFIVGTPDYMSPEQAKGTVVDERSDIFSAGAVFYFMLTGRKPFQAPDLPAVLHKVIVEDPLPLRDVEAPAALARIVGRALAKDPAQRYQRFRDLLGDLVRVGRRYDAETRAAASAAWTMSEAMAGLLEEERSLSAALDIALPDTRADRTAAIITEHPELGDRGLAALKTLPLRRAVVETIAGKLNEAYAGIATRVTVLREAHDALEAGRACTAAEDYTSAVRHFERAVEAASESGVARAELERARQICDERQKQDDRARALLLQAADERRAGQFATALALAEQAAALLPEDREAANAIGALRNEIARQDEERRRRTDYHFERVDRAAAKGRLDDAERELTLARAAGAAGPDLDRRTAEVAALREAADAARTLQSEAAAALTNARGLFAAGDREPAISALREFSVSHPGAPGINAELSRLAAEHERLVREARLAEEAVAKACESEQAWAGGDAGTALRLAEAALALAPAEPRARTVAGLARARLREIAARDVRIARAVAHAVKARELVGAGHYDRALCEAQKGSELDPANPDLATVAADALRLQEEWAVARARQAAAAQRVRAARPALVASRAALAAGDSVRAKWAAENALALDPDSADARGLIEAAEAAAKAPGATDDDTVDALTPATEDTAAIRIGMESRLRDRAEVYAAAMRETVEAARGRASRVLARLRSSRGQTTTEWLMIAGLLTAMVFLGMRYLPDLLRDLVLSIAWGIRTIAP
ncbi:MAG: hypothetical protein A3H96_15915 [Acidobacteria bacterium RIFCSPLOWO2_02_FULL_67_36]|nr:MAG: hypothetical protein A3H96_15915 [Acidobacteria bacterium RIFCSPLOWO2_02_FULL_67_36]OFW22104.1 MAG: hypothetical protein A3G21_19135 [Acidobacteria bacterium RIFCSPLOWO2_12_FULL_66_21]